MTVDAENESKKMDPMDPRMDWGKASLAVVANNNGQGCVLWTAGPHVAIDLEQIGTGLGDIGLDDAPHGISVWEGRTEGGGRRDTQDGVDYEDTRLVGAFREPTPPEWDAIMRNVSPWDDDDWMLPTCLDCGAVQPHHCPAAVEGDSPPDDGDMRSHHPECNDPHCGGGC